MELGFKPSTLAKSSLQLLPLVLAAFALLLDMLSTVRAPVERRCACVPTGRQVVPLLQLLVVVRQWYAVRGVRVTSKRGWNGKGRARGGTVIWLCVF